MKKINSLFLAILMCGSVLFVTAGAEENDAEYDSLETAEIINEEAQRLTVKAAASAMLGKDASEEIDVSEDFVDEVLDKAGDNPTAEDISSIISGYVAIYRDWSDEQAKIIADSSLYYISEDGDYYIVVDIEHHPEVMELSVLYKSTKLMYDRQNEFAATDDSDCVYMDYQHMVGELALHNVVYVLTKMVNGESETSPFYDIYERAKVAELNAFEPRGVLLIKILGTFLVYFYSFFSNLIK